MTHIIAEPCVGVKDTACVDVCPVDCIYGKDEDWEMLYIHPEECIDCGLCVDACPVQAIFPDTDVPDEQKSFITYSLAPAPSARAICVISVSVVTIIMRR